MLEKLYLKIINRIANFYKYLTDTEDHKDAHCQNRLTQFPNREQLVRSFNESIKTQKNQEQAIVIVNIDRLHSINELYGREVGDQVILQLIERLKKMFKDENTIFNDDHFYLRLKNVSVNELDEVGENIIRTINKPLHIENKTFRITVSIGMSHYPTTGKDIESLLQQAETTMLQIKKSGKNNYAVIQKEELKIIERKRRLEFDLKEALEKEELSIHYQPEVCLKKGEIKGVEALLRWEHSELGNISPNEFIPIAEETGIIHEIGQWTIQQSIKEVKKWHDCGVKIYLSVNISYEQFKGRSLIQDILTSIEENEFDGRYFVVEVTESVMKDLNHINYVTQALKKEKIRIAIDDFGTGYSSLSTIGATDIDLIKIDRHFIKNLPYDKKAAQMVKMIIKIAESLDSYVIAEGVENLEQVEFLKENACKYAQGYYFGRPVLPNELLDNAKKQSCQ